MESPPPSSKLPEPFDALILGGGPAGLAAAVYLGRYLRTTLVLDEKKPRTYWHRPIANNVLGFPAGIHRNQLLDWGRAHIARYDKVHLRQAAAATLSHEGKLFKCTDTDGESYLARGLILALGVEYELPSNIPDIYAYAGRSIFHCPECDGFKCLDKQIVVIGNDRGSADMALGLTIWTRHVTLLTHDKPDEIDDEARRKLDAAKIAVQQARITRIRGNAEEGTLEGFELDNGKTLDAHAAFINYGCTPPDDLFKQLPLELHKNRWLKTDFRMRTNIPRCYAAGDIIAFGQTQLSVAMGTGATAAIWLHRELMPENLCLTDRATVPQEPIA
jgi:thioredoxin reductase